MRKHLFHFLPVLLGALIGGRIFAGECCDGNGVTRIEIDAQDTALRLGVEVLKGEDFNDAIRVIDAERKNWLRFFSASAVLSLEILHGADEPVTLKGRFEMKTVPRGAKTRNDDLPWKFQYTLTDLNNEWKIETDGESATAAKITAKDEATKQKLAERTTSGQILGIFGLPQSLVLGIYSDELFPHSRFPKILMLTALPPCARKYDIPAGAKKKLVSFALMKAFQPRAKSFLFREGHFHQFIVPPEDIDRDVEKTFTFDRYTTTSEGFSFPTTVRMDFRRTGYSFLLKLDSLTAVLRDPKKEKP